MTPFQIIDYAGVAVFAATGALAASRKQLDIIGFLFLASLTGIGGGTIRDLVLGVSPVFWVANSAYLAVCIVTAALLYFTAPLVEYRYRLLLWLDAIGLAAYCVMGAQRGLEIGASPLVAIVTGMMTATVGGVLRDVVSNEPSVLLRREIYITAALVGASGFVALRHSGIDPGIAAWLAGLLALAVRGGALAFGWTLPGYRHRAGRPSDGQ
ncbi:MAG: trimeric intracellular cation channel family protein [Nitratireductor sp.]